MKENKTSLKSSKASKVNPKAKKPPVKNTAKAAAQKSRKQNTTASEINVAKDTAGITAVSKVESAESKGLRVDIQHLKNLDKDELKEVYQVLSEVNHEESQEIVAKIIQETKAPPIEKAKIGHRVWTYFYDKAIFRVGLVIWFLFFNPLKAAFDQKIPLPEDMETAKFPPFLKPLFTEQGDAIFLGSVIFIAVLLGLWISWRLWTAFMESKRNHHHPGSTFCRRNLRIVLVDRRGQPIGWLRTFLRGLFRLPIVSMITLATMEFSSNNRGIHDKIFGTYALRINEDVLPVEIASFIQSNYLS